jgi:phytoene dehydrogenase-like protein
LNERAIVIGAGADELVAAHLLARAGRQVLALDERPPEALTEPTIGWALPQIVRELDLERHGFRSAPADPWLVVPVDGGSRLELWRDLRRSIE